MNDTLDIEDQLRRMYRAVAETTQVDIELPEATATSGGRLIVRPPVRLLSPRPSGRGRVAIAAAALVVAGLGAAVVTLDGDKDTIDVGQDRGAPFLPDAPINPRYGHSAVWTGQEMIVFGGYNDSDNDGNFDETDASTRPAGAAAYNPATREWRKIADLPASVRGGNLAFWTGSEVIAVYTGHNEIPATEGTPLGAIYNPDDDTWRFIEDPRIGALPYLPQNGIVQWTGDRLLLTGMFSINDGPPIGLQDEGLLAAAYDPATDQWEALPNSPIALSDRGKATWTGSELVYIGPDTDNQLTAVALDPAGKSWRALPAPPLPDRYNPLVSWNGQEVVVAGGREPQYDTPAPELRDAATFDPATDTWTTLPDLPVAVEPTPIVNGGDVVGGSMLAWYTRDPVQRVLLLDRATHTWHWGPTPPGPQPWMTAIVNTGDGILVWGGTGPDDEASGTGYEMKLP